MKLFQGRAARLFKELPRLEPASSTDRSATDGNLTSGLLTKQLPCSIDFGYVGVDFPNLMNLRFEMLSSYDVLVAGSAGHLGTALMLTLPSLPTK